MRIIVAVLIWICFVGGVGLYIHHRSRAAVTSAGPVEMETAEGNYALEITSTFIVEPDPFAIQSNDQEKPSALLVRLGDLEIIRITDRMEAGTPIRVEPLRGLVIGDNEIYVEANPPLNQAGRSHALRMQVLKNGQAWKEKTFWSTPGGKVADTLRLILIPSQTKEDPHAHP